MDFVTGFCLNFKADRYSMKHRSRQISGQTGSAHVGLAFLNFVITPRFGVCPSYALWRGQRRWGARVLRLMRQVRFQAAAGSTGVFPQIVVP